MQQTPLSSAETISRAKALYETHIAALIPEADRKKLLELDLLSGDFEVDMDEDAMHDRLKARQPEGQFVIMQADGGPAGRFGSL